MHSLPSTALEGHTQGPGSPRDYLGLNLFSVSK